MQCVPSKILSVCDLGEEYYRIILERPENMVFTPGQFVSVMDQNSPDLLRRPFSVASQTQREILLLIKEVGKMTKRLRKSSPGDCLSVMGPLGKGFDTSGQKKALLIGGGVGIAPLLGLSQELDAQGRDYLCLLGFRDECEPAKLFKKTNLRIHRETKDPGFVTDLLKEVLQEGVEVFACGPLPMLKVVRSMCMEAGVPSQLSLEGKMACGIGACIGCAVPVKDNTGTVYKKVCSDGPVFRGEELAWE